MYKTPPISMGFLLIILIFSLSALVISIAAYHRAAESSPAPELPPAGVSATTTEKSGQTSTVKDLDRESSQRRAFKTLKARTSDQ